MDPEDSQPTQQATQNVVDPRRLGKQNSGFSDEDIPDIICLLLPYSEAARREVARIAAGSSQHLVRREDADNVDLDYSLEDNVHEFGMTPYRAGEHAIVLKLSAQVKNPLQGFTFGRNPTRCDICFTNDPLRRLSNIHFRIYLNEYGVLMLEDQSTNGTVVDGTLLKSRSKQKSETRRTLSSGTKVQILMHDVALDLDFLVRIPRRDGEFEELYRRNMKQYLDNVQLLAAGETETIRPGPTGHVELFPVAEQIRQTRPSQLRFAPPETTQENVERLSREWTGSNKYNRVTQIGKGAFATVYKVTSKFDGKPYAAKELDKRKFMKNGVLDQKVENEMTIMQRVQHRHIVRYIEHLDWDNRLFIIIMEYVPGGDLGRLIAEEGPLPEDVVKEMSSQLLDALGYLHENNITHRDVKPDNILIQSHQPFAVKLTDFGLSKMVDNEQTFLRTFCGTLLYCAPEVYTEYAEYDEYGHRNPRNRHRRAPYGKRYDHAVDIWSLGGVLFYALTGSPPYPVKTGISYTELLNQIMTRKLDISPLVRSHTSAYGIDFLSRMLDRRPEQRATVDGLKAHSWLGGSNSSRSFDEISDDGLEQGASQLSLKDNPEVPDVIPQSDDEIIEDDEVDEDIFNDYESQKENYTFGPGNQPQKLFGEVNVSAIGSSGAIPSNLLNLPMSASSLSETELIGSEIRDSYGSDDLSTPKLRKSQGTQSGGVRPTLNQSKSVDELNNMTFDVASQSLGGAESIMENLNMKSLAPSNFDSRADSFNASKRKPSHDTSDEFDKAAVTGKPSFKRLKSDVVMESLGDSSDDSDSGLFATIPPISRLQSGRQIDRPVHKSIYWDAQDMKTWHLRYPEMTQLQHDAFRSGAEARGEIFAPGRTALWELAMKHFPPAGLSGESTKSGSPMLDANGRKDDFDPPPPTLGLGDVDSLPDTQPPETQIIVPIHTDAPGNRIIGSLQSTPDSVVQGISVLITQSITSWGRAFGNTHIYTPKTEAKVPKHGFKILLWKEGYDPSKNFRPWTSKNGSSDDFHFYIATKATNGIQVNGMTVPSHEPKNPEGPSRNWVRLYDGDNVVVWRNGADAKQVTKLSFRCSWGGSSQPRASPASERFALVPGETARRLDDATHKAEKRISGLVEQDSRIEEADAEYREREKNIERERERSQAFEVRRFEACRIMAMRASRRNSPASAPATIQNGPHFSTTQSSSGGNPLSAPTLPGGRAVPVFRHGSPAANALRAMADEEE